MRQAKRDRLDELEMDAADDQDDEEAGRTMLTLTTASDMIRKYKNQPFVLWSLLKVVRNLVRGENYMFSSVACWGVCLFHFFFF